MNILNIQTLNVRTSHSNLFLISPDHVEIPGLPLSGQDSNKEKGKEGLFRKETLELNCCIYGLQQIYLTIYQRTDSRYQMPV